MQEGINRDMDVIFYATLRQIVRCQDGGDRRSRDFTVRELLAEIIRRYPALAREMFDEDGNLYSHVASSSMEGICHLLMTTWRLEFLRQIQSASSRGRGVDP